MEDPRLAAPEHQFFARAIYRLGDLIFALQTNYIGGVYIQLPNPEEEMEASTENYFLLHASAKYFVREDIELFLGGKNLLNTDYQIDYGYPMHAINFMMGIGIKF